MKHIKPYFVFESEQESSIPSNGKICLVNNSYYSQEGGDLTVVIVTKAPTLRRALELMCEVISDFEGMDIPDDYKKALRSCESSSDVEGAVSAYIEEWWEEENNTSTFGDSKVKIVDAIPFSEDRLKAINTIRSIDYEEPVTASDIKKIKGSEFVSAYIKNEDKTPSEVSALIDLCTNTDESLSSYID